MASVSTANITTSVANAYVSTGNTAITFFTLCNYSAGNATTNVYLVPSGGTAGNNNIILSNLLITSNDTYQMYQAAEKMLLSNGDSIQVSANANSAITTVATYTSI